MQDAFSQDMFNISDLNNPRYNGHVQSCGIKTTGSGGTSSTGGGKKDRKGCTKGKIEAIMRNNAIRTKVVIPLNVSSTTAAAAANTTPLKKSVSSVTTSAINNNQHHHHQMQQQHQQQQQSHSVVLVHNHQVSSAVNTSNRHEPIRLKDEPYDDPYTFTESEPPQCLGVYQAGSGTTGASKPKNVAMASPIGPPTKLQQHRATNTLGSAATDQRNRVDRITGGAKLMKSSHQPIGSLTSVTPNLLHSDTALHSTRIGGVHKTIQLQSVPTTGDRQLSSTTTSRTVATKRKAPSTAANATSITSKSCTAAGGGSTSSYNNLQQGHHAVHEHLVAAGGTTTTTTTTSSSISIKTPHQHHQHRRSQLPNRVCLPAKRQLRKSVWQRERNAKHELLERIHGVQCKLASYNKDLYPLGIEVSDSESDEFELERRAIYERHWFSRTDPDVWLPPDDEYWHHSKGRSAHVSSSSATMGGVDEVDTSPRERRVEFARAETRRRLAQTLAGVKSAGEPSAELVAAVVRAAKVVPNATALLLTLNGGNQSTSPPTTSNRINRGARFLTTGEKCSYSEGCHYQALPATRHCLRHIMYNVDQRLFSHCTGRLEDNTQCNRPTFDPAHLSPLCPLHSTQASVQQQPAANIGRTSADSSKHSRKKNRLLGISRNNKRSNKKRKKSSSLLVASTAHSHDLHNSSNHHHHYYNNHHHHHHHHHHQQQQQAGGGASGSGGSAGSFSTANSSNPLAPATTELHQHRQQIKKEDQHHSHILPHHHHHHHPHHQQSLVSGSSSGGGGGATGGRLQQHSVGTDTDTSPPISLASSGALVSQDDVDQLVTSVVTAAAADDDVVGVDGLVVGSAGDSLLHPAIQHRSHHPTDIGEEVSEEVLAIEALDPVELANQTTRLLEEHDLNNVLNQISTDLAFNDLFTDKNGEYEPTREETEELERALEAVDNDVRSLERMTRALPIPLPLLQLPLEGLLDTATTTAATTTSTTSIGGSAACPPSSGTTPSSGPPPPPSNGNVNFDDTSDNSPSAVCAVAAAAAAAAATSFHNGFVDSPVQISTTNVAAAVTSSTLVSDTLHQST